MGAFMTYETLASVQKLVSRSGPYLEGGIIDIFKDGKIKVSATDQKIIKEHAIHWAVEADFPDLVFYLAKEGYSLDHQIKNRTPVQRAATMKYWRCVKAIAMHLADHPEVNQDDCCKLGSALVDAVDAKQPVELIDQLRRGGANLNWGFTATEDYAIHIAAKKNLVATLKSLLPYAAFQLSEQNKDNKTPIQLALSEGNWGSIEAIANYLAKNPGDNKNDACKLGVAMIAALIYKLSTQLIENLYRGGASVKSVDSKTGNYAVHLAVKNGLLLELKILLQHPGITETLFIRNKNDKTPIEIALDEKNWDMISLLTEHIVAQRNNKFELIETNKEALSSVVTAAINANKFDKIKNLLEDAIKRNELSVYRLHKTFAWALQNEQHSLYELLLSSKFNLCEESSDLPTESKYHDGNTLLHLAIKFDHIALAKLLIPKMNNIDAVNSDGDTPLHLVVKSGQAELVEPLLRRNASYTAENNDRKLAVELIADNDGIKIKDILEKHINNIGLFNGALKEDNIEKINEAIRRFPEKDYDILRSRLVEEALVTMRKSLSLSRSGSFFSMTKNENNSEKPQAYHSLIKNVLWLLANKYIVLSQQSIDALMLIKETVLAQLKLLDMPSQFFLKKQMENEKDRKMHPLTRICKSASISLIGSNELDKWRKNLLGTEPPRAVVHDRILNKWQKESLPEISLSDINSMETPQGPIPSAYTYVTDEYLPSAPCVSQNYGVEREPLYPTASTAADDQVKRREVAAELPTSFGAPYSSNSSAYSTESLASNEKFSGPLSPDNHALYEAQQFLQQGLEKLAKMFIEVGMFPATVPEKSIITAYQKALFTYQDLMAYLQTLQDYQLSQQYCLLSQQATAIEPVTELVSWQNLDVRSQAEIASQIGFTANSSRGSNYSSQIDAPQNVQLVI